MGMEFLAIAFAILFAIGFVVLSVLSRRKVRRKQELKHLMARIGMVNEHQMTFEELYLAHSDRAWFRFINGKFKQAGYTERKPIIQLIGIQLALVLFSLIVFVLKGDVLTFKQLLLTAILPVAPVVFLYVKAHQRQAELKEAFPEMLDSIVRALHSGYGVDGAIASFSKEGVGPLAQEMEEVHKQLNVGISMREILREFQSRVNLPEAQFFVVTLIIQRETGGQLSAILKDLSDLMRRRKNFEAKLKTLTAETRFTAWFIGGAPILYLLYKIIFDMDSMTFYLSDPLGIKLLVMSVGLILVGSFILYRMLQIRF